MLLGMCVNTMVRIRPIRLASRPDASYDAACSNAIAANAGPRTFAGAPKRTCSQYAITALTTRPPPSASIANSAESGARVRICVTEMTAARIGASARGERRMASTAVTRPTSAYTPNRRRPRLRSVAVPASSPPAAAASPPVSE